jgi:Restriction endonuclease
MSLEEGRYIQASNPWIETIRSRDTTLAGILTSLDSLGCVLEHLDKTNNEDLLAQQAEGVHNPWDSAGSFYFYTDRTLDAAVVFRRLYERLCICQRERKTWVAKGLPLERIAECHERLGHHALSARYLLLTAVSDAIRDGGRLERSSAVFLKGLQRGWDAGTLSTFCADCNASYDPNDPLSGFPEHLLSRVNVPFSISSFAPSELDIYEINTVYASAIMEAMNSKSGDKTGKALERLATYVLGSIPGFDMVHGVISRDSQYDGIIRNVGPKYDFRSDLGFYLLVECKDWDKPIGVPQVSHFINKLVLQQCRGGILFSSQGITGGGSMRDAELQLLKAHYGAGKVILVLGEQDFNQIANGANLITMLRDKYEQVRFDISS